LIFFFSFFNNEPISIYANAAKALCIHEGRSTLQKGQHVDEIDIVGGRALYYNVQLACAIHIR
jgi:hypothetical protein